MYGYLRVSTEEQAENPEGSIKNQEHRLRDFVRIKSIGESFGEVVAVFSDPGISAKNMNRPGLSALSLLLAAAGSKAFNFGAFGGDAHFHQAYLLLVLLCLASGLQNAAITSSSGRSVRTTHLTGLTTDLGLGLSKIFSFDLRGEKKRAELRANYLRIGSIISFVIGSAIGAIVFVKLGYSGFFLPAGIAAFAAFHGRKAKGADSLAE